MTAKSLTTLRLVTWHSSHFKRQIDPFLTILITKNYNIKEMYPENDYYDDNADTVPERPLPRECGRLQINENQVRPPFAGEPRAEPLNNGHGAAQNRIERQRVQFNLDTDRKTRSKGPVPNIGRVLNAPIENSKGAQRPAQYS